MRVAGANRLRLRKRQNTKICKKEGHSDEVCLFGQKDLNGEGHLAQGDGPTISKADAAHLVEEALNRVEKVMEALEVSKKDQKKVENGGEDVQKEDVGVQDKEGGVSSDANNDSNGMSWEDEEDELGLMDEEGIAGVRTINQIDSQIVTNSQNQALSRPITLEEVKEAVFSMPRDKALGPNGFLAFFFHQFWEVVGDEVWLVVEESRESACVDKELNYTFIALIPKVEKVET
ncbi:uncharacterized protein LOC131859090 [Cryptomeria japonica]|uniref:uncharacterized protein LOC131859090 n=1 Tax=Cryptomeria japonica TaxID=3369 RepID=UPI0027DA16B9|nr:uncharacterized protein LOC131859090 [Cryptomeria japonica]